MASQLHRGMIPSPGEWARVQDVFLRVLEFPPEQRGERVLMLCGSDTGLRARVEQLLAGHDGADGLLALAITETMTAHPVEHALPLPYTAGAYRLLDKVGCGGMGSVYRAERADGRFQKRVAVKVLAGRYDTTPTEERFCLERQILAGLEHPYISRLMDGGVTADGRQYIVMEYVEGTPIHWHARERNLTVNQIVALFEKVCAAVEYAHQHSVVHCDIKPGNLLITADGTPRLLDFGISKLWSGTLPEGQHAGGTEVNGAATPHYASPEQLAGAPATPAADVYSLGVLLCELLSGQRPDRSTFAPTPPSAVRGPERRGGRISRDLDAIVLKALAQDPEARYDSAGGLRADLQGYLSSRPVAARRGTILTRLGKAMARHRWQVAALTVAAVCAAGLTAMYRYQARKAAERRYESVRSIQALFRTMDGRMAALPESSEARRLLIGEVTARLEDLEKGAGNDAELLYQLAVCHLELARAYDGATGYALGDAHSALDSLVKAQRFLGRAAGLSGNGRDYLLLVRTLSTSVSAAERSSRFQEVIIWSAEAESLIQRRWRQFIEEGQADKLQHLLASMPSIRGQALEAQNRMDEALKAWGVATREISAHANGSRPYFTNVEASHNGFLALHYCYTGNPQRGAEYAERAKVLAEKLFPANARSPTDLFSWASGIVAECAVQANQHRAALRILNPLRDAALLQLRRDPENYLVHWVLADHYALAGEALVNLGRLSEASNSFHAALNLTGSPQSFASSPAAQELLGYVYAGLGSVERRQATAARRSAPESDRQLESACSYYKQALATWNAFLGAHGGLAIASRTSMSRVAEEFQQYCIVSPLSSTPGGLAEGR